MRDTVTVDLALCCLVAVAVAAGALITLHLLPTGRQPVRDGVRDYGVGPFSPGYRLVVLALGTGALALAAAFARDGTASAWALAWLVAYALSRFAIAWSPTDPRGTLRTRTDRVHVLLAAVGLTAIAVAASSLPDGLAAGPRWQEQAGRLDAVGTVVAWTAVATGLCYLVPRLRRVFGLVERALYLAVFAWLTLAAAGLVAVNL